MKSSNITYSVIIPHKNTLVFLIRLVDSIPNRKDLEIIIVDDNSDNVSEHDWDMFREKYPQAQLYMTYEGRGAGYARNIGLSHATGKWLIFADADDFFYQQAFDYIDAKCTDELDIIYFLCNSRNGKNLKPCADRMPIIRKYIYANDINGLRFNSLVPWGKVIKRSLIEEHQIRFDEIEVSNDVMFSMRVGVNVKRAAIIADPLYCCTKNFGSLHFNKNIRRAKIRLQVYKNANDFLHSHGLDDYRLPFYRSAYPHMKVFLPKHPLSFIEYLWRIRYKDNTGKYLSELATLTREKIKAELPGFKGRK